MIYYEQIYINRSTIEAIKKNSLKNNQTFNIYGHTLLQIHLNIFLEKNY